MPNPTKTVSVSAGTRIYYFDALTDNKGQHFLSISEIPVDRSPGHKKRQRLFIHHEDLDRFGEAFAEIASHIKNVTER